MTGQINIIGDGAMGTLCAILLAENGLNVRLWSAFPEAAEMLSSTRENIRFLPGVRLPDNVEVTGRDDEALAGADAVVSAVPTQFVRQVWQRLSGHVKAETPICSVAKGIENHSLRLPTQVLRDVLGESVRVAVLSGPCIAPEVARKLPATVAAASEDPDLGKYVQKIFSRPYFRVYTNPDPLGVEMAGATKNVIAIAAGILDGLDAGVNAKAALLTRGLVEITRLGVAVGARAETFNGLAGMGDLVTTCFSPIGRNRSFGDAVGSGKSVADALAATDSVVEGVATAASVIELADRKNVEMPITGAVYEVIFEERSPEDAIRGLMTRPLKSEA